MKLSVIIPTFNEEENLPGLLSDLQQQNNIQLEIIIADGGSFDRTKEITREKNVTLINSQKGRAVQMNSAAKQANSELLLFLHADTRLSDNKLLSRAISNFHEFSQNTKNNLIAGHFPLKFSCSAKKRAWAYNFYEAKTALNRPGTVNGDQGLLIRKEFFFEIGGFDESLPFLEDQQLAAKIFGIGDWLLLPGRLITSARRFEKEGLARRMIISAIIMGLHESKFEPFYKEARQFYLTHDESQKLQMTPFFTAIINLIKLLRLKDRLSSWIKVGRYVRQNAWQLFFLADLLVTHRIIDKNLLLRFHDSVVAPLLNFYLFDIIAGFLTYCWFKTSQVYFRLTRS